MKYIFPNNGNKKVNLREFIPKIPIISKFYYMDIKVLPYLEMTKTARRETNPANQKKELKRIDWDIVRRMVTLLMQNNGMKKTHIAMKCKLSYDKCLLYLEWLKIVDFVSKEIDDEGFELIRLNDRGKDLYKRKFKNIGKMLVK